MIVLPNLQVGTILRLPVGFKLDNGDLLLFAETAHVLHVNAVEGSAFLSNGQVLRANDPRNNVIVNLGVTARPFAIKLVVLQQMQKLNPLAFPSLDKSTRINLTADKPNGYQFYLEGNAVAGFYLRLGGSLAGGSYCALYTAPNEFCGANSGESIVYNGQLVAMVHEIGVKEGKMTAELLFPR